MSSGERVTARESFIEQQTRALLSRQSMLCVDASTTAGLFENQRTGAAGVTDESSSDNPGTPF